MGNGSVRGPVKKGGTAPAGTSALQPTEVEQARGDAASLAHGRALFAHSWTRRDGMSRGGDGLGPHFNGSSCAACHNQGAIGGAGGAHGNAFIFDGEMVPRHGDEDGSLSRARFARIDRDPTARKKIIVVNNAGATAEGPLERQFAITELLDLVRPAVQPCLAEAKIDGPDRKFGFKRFEVKFTVDEKGVVTSAPTTKDKDLKGRPAVLACMKKALEPVRLPEAKAPSTITWNLTLSEVQGPLTTSGQRNPSALFGMGVIDAIDDKHILANEGRAIPGHPEITGVVGRTEKGEVAKFGWKGDVKGLDTFVVRACALEVGLEVPGMHQFGFDDSNAVGLDLNADDVEDLQRFVRSLPRPTHVESAETKRGARLFEKVGCTTCHAANVGGVDGIYSDLLLHDMGAAMADGGGYGGGNVAAKDREWRTPPLWGARDSGPWLHDGRAQTLRDAVMFHGGEAAIVRQAYEELRADDQQAIVSFLESLQAPAI